jgi:hypothetical protein
MPEPSMEAPTTSTEFDPEQKRYLEGFMSGLQIARAARAVPASANGTGGVVAPAAEPMGPDADHGVREPTRSLLGSYRAERKRRRCGR